jgi:hypothetical protein
MPRRHRPDAVGVDDGAESRIVAEAKSRLVANLFICPAAKLA